MKDCGFGTLGGLHAAKEGCLPIPHLFIYSFVRNFWESTACELQWWMRQSRTSHYGAYMSKQNTPSYSGHHDGEEVFRNRCDSMGSSLGGPSFWWLILVDFLRNLKSSFLLCKRNTWRQLHWPQWQPKEREQEPPSYISVSWSSSEIAELSQTSWWFGKKIQSHINENQGNRRADGWM